MADHARAGHAEGVTDGDGAAVDIEAIVGDAQGIAAVQHLAGEGLVDLPQADVRGGQAEALEQLGNGVHRADAHLLRGTAGHRDAPIDAQRRQAAALGLAALHHQAGRGAVGELGGVAGGDVLALGDPLAVLPHRREGRQALEAGLGAVALVAGGGDLAMARRLTLVIEQQLPGGERHDLVVEAPGLLGRGGALLALQGVAVLGLAADAVAPGDQLGGLDHRDIGRGHRRLHRLGLGAIGVLVPGLGQRERLHAAGHGGGHLAGHDAARGHADGHQPRGAHPIQRHARYALRQAGGIGAQPADVVGLGALLHRRAHDHVLDGASLDPGALEHGTHHMAAEHRGLGVVEGAAERLGQRGARRGDNYCVFHRKLLTF